MQIRKAKLKDINQLITLAIDLLAYHQKLDSYFAPVKNLRKVYQKFFKGSIYSGNRCVLVAEKDNNIIGYTVGELYFRPPVFKIQKIGQVSDVFVERNYRKSGIAKQFLDELFKWFKVKKIEYVEISAHIKNNIGKKAWERSGFSDFMMRQRVKVDDFK